jgi:hypothetical protein
MRRLQTTEGRTCRGPVLTVVILTVVFLGLVSAAFTVLDHRPRRDFCPNTRVCISQIEVAVRTYEVRTGRFPDSLDQLVHPIGERPALLDKRMLIDSWGNSIAYAQTNETFVIRCAGPDGIMCTADDLVNH